jgi:GTP pyrophosphokinase
MTTEPQAPATRARTRRTISRPAAAPADASLEVLRERLLAEVRTHHPGADLGDVERAFALAVEAHADQKRASGEPYVVHPIASAQILAEIGLDPVAIVAALLHDVPEDTEYRLSDIEEGFGPKVAHLVDGVTKLSRFSTHSHEQQQAENIRKMFLAMADDIRVVLIKLADRLHNMRTLGAPTREAAADRAPDAGDLRPPRRAARDLADQVGARGPRLQGARARALP